MSDLCGLVLAGGQSSRMGRSKAELVYHDEPHAAWLYQLLTRTCGRAVVSLGASSTPDSTRRSIVDEIPDRGPIGGVLTAHKEFPTAALLVVACDMPLVDEAGVRALLTARGSSFDAVCYEHAEGHPEPLFALYERPALDTLARRSAEGDQSLRRALVALGPRVLRLVPRASELLTNLNTPEELTEFRRLRGPLP